MRLSFLLLFLGISCLAAQYQEAIPRDKFDEYVHKFQKSYINTADKEKRREVFAKNVKEINEFNELAERDNISFRLDVNQFTEYEYEEFVSLFTGLKANKNDTIELNDDALKNRQVLIEKVLHDPAPSYKNWVEEGKVTPIKNQGSCGACWAFATVAVIESMNAINGYPLVSLSEQQLMDCNYDSNNGNWACEGGLFPGSFYYARYNGVMKKSDYPYIGQRSYCKYAKSRVAGTTGQYARILSEYELKKIVANKGPVAIGIFVSPVFSRYSSGIIDDPSCVNRTPNHGVVVVGYGTERGRDYWLVRNSWGPSWGENGYFKMARNKNMCNILSMAYYSEFN